jgi:hypothetical protein
MYGCRGPAWHEVNRKSISGAGRVQAKARLGKWRCFVDVWSDTIVSVAIEGGCCCKTEVEAGQDGDCLAPTISCSPIHDVCQTIPSHTSYSKLSNEKQRSSFHYVIHATEICSTFSISHASLTTCHSDVYANIYTHRIYKISRRPVDSSMSTIWCTAVLTFSFSRSTTKSAFVGTSYSSSTPVKFLISPRLALA